jgi:LacI family transcriptional regulator
MASIEKTARPSITEVAEASNVSVATVSRVMNNKPGVTKDVEERVREAMERLGYQRLRRPKRSLKGVVPEGLRNFLPVGCMMPPNPWGNSIWPLAMGSAAQRLQEHGYPVALHVPPAREGEPYVLPELHSGVSGWIVADRRPEQIEALRKIAARGQPAVRIGYFPMDVPVPQVVGDYMLGCLKLMQHLIGQGHKRIAYFRAGTPEQEGDWKQSNDIEKAAAYHVALAEAGLPYDPSIVFTLNFNMQKIEKAMRHLLTIKPAPTAIFIDNDWTTHMMQVAGSNRNIDFMRHFEIAHFIETPQHPSHYGFTCALVPMHLLGQLAGDILLRRFAGSPFPNDMILKPVPTFHPMEEVMRLPRSVVG